MQLHCRTGFHIGIFADGKVRGIDRDLDDFGKLICLVMLMTVEIPSQFLCPVLCSKFKFCEFNLYYFCRITNHIIET